MRGTTVLLTLAILAIFSIATVAEEPAFEMCAAKADPGNPDLNADTRVMCGGSANYLAPLPPRRAEPDILTMIGEKSSAFSTFLSAISAADLERLLGSKGPITLFLPTNQAFAQMSDEAWSTILSDPQKCREFLLAHIVRGKVKTADLKTVESLATAQGTSLSVESSSEGIRIENAKVIFWDIPAKNGFIHVIDAVLSPGIQVALK